MLIMVILEHFSGNMLIVPKWFVTIYAESQRIHTSLVLADETSARAGVAAPLLPQKLFGLASEEN